MLDAEGKASPRHLKVLEMNALQGLELETAPFAREPNTFILLNDIELINSNTLTTARGFGVLHDIGDYEGRVVAIRRYQEKPSEDAAVVGLTNIGELYNVETGEFLGAFPQPVARVSDFYMTDYPFVTVLPQTYNNETLQFLVTTTLGGVYKWSPTTGAIPVGGAGPVNGCVVYALWTTDDKARGVPVLVSRRYRTAFWNPNTKRESSPSPSDSYSYIDYTNANIKIPQNKSYVLSVILQPNLSAYTPTVYQKVRLYATRDGGGEFYVVKNIVAAYANSIDPAPIHWEVADADGAVPLWTTVGGSPRGIRYLYDGLTDTSEGSEDLLSGSVLGLGANPIIDGGFSARAPYADPLLVEPTANAGENDAPPPSVWGCTYQGRLFLVPRSDQTRLVFSKAGDFESFPSVNYFQLVSDQFDPIVALDGQEQQLIIGKERSVWRLVGTDLTDFVLMPLDKQVGFVGRRAFVHMHGRLVFLSREGLMEWSANGAAMYGRSIKPLTNTIPYDIKFENVCGTFDSQAGIGLLSVWLSETPRVLMFDESEKYPFSVWQDLPGSILDMQEVRLSTGEVAIVFSNWADRKLYKYPTSEQPEGRTAEVWTQHLPSKDLVTKKRFRRLYVEFDTQTEPWWEYTYAIDQGLPRPWRSLQRNNWISCWGRTIQLRFRRPCGPGPGRLSNIRLEYVLVGETR